MTPLPADHPKRTMREQPDLITARCARCLYPWVTVAWEGVLRDNECPRPDCSGQGLRARS